MTMPSVIGSAVATAASAPSVTVDVSTIDSGSPPRRGDLLIFMSQSQTAPANIHTYITDTSRSELHRTKCGSYGVIGHTYWKIWEDGDDQTVLIWYAGGNFPITVVAVCIRDADPIMPICDSSMAYVTSTSCAAVARTTPVDNCLAVSFKGIEINEAITPTSTWTEQIDQQQTSMVTHVQYKEFPTASTSTGTAAVTVSSSVISHNHLYLIQEAQGPPQEDVRAKTGIITAPASTGNQDTTTGFPVKALITWTTYRENTTVTSNLIYQIGIGADDGVTTAAQRYVGMNHTNGAATSYGWSGLGEIIKVYDIGSTTLESPDMEATYSSLTNGFRLNWTATTSGKIIHYLALGGDDLQAAVGSTLANAYSVSGLAFRPEVSFALTQGSTSNVDQIRATGVMTFGATDWRTQGTWSQWSRCSNSQGHFFPRTDLFIGRPAVGGGLGWYCGNLYADSDGFHWSSGSTDYFFYLALSSGGKNFPWQVTISDKTPITTSNFVDGFPFTGGYLDKQSVMMALCRGAETTDEAAGTVCLGQAYFDGAPTNSCDAIGMTGTTSERAYFDDRLGVETDGDLDSINQQMIMYDMENYEMITQTALWTISCLFCVGKPKPTPGSSC